MNIIYQVDHPYARTHGYTLRGYVPVVPLAWVCTHILGYGLTTGAGAGKPSGTRGCTRADL